MSADKEFPTPHSKIQNFPSYFSARHYAEAGGASATSREAFAKRGSRRPAASPDGDILNLTTEFKFDLRMSFSSGDPSIGRFLQIEPQRNPERSLGKDLSGIVFSLSWRLVQDPLPD